MPNEVPLSAHSFIFSSPNIIIQTVKKQISAFLYLLFNIFCLAITGNSKITHLPLLSKFFFFSNYAKIGIPISEMMYLTSRGFEMNNEVAR